MLPITYQPLVNFYRPHNLPYQPHTDCLVYHYHILTTCIPTTAYTDCIYCLYWPLYTTRSKLLLPKTIESFSTSNRQELKWKALPNWHTDQTQIFTDQPHHLPLPTPCRHACHACQLHTNHKPTSRSTTHSWPQYMYYHPSICTAACGSCYLVGAFAEGLLSIIGQTNWRAFEFVWGMISIVEIS